MSKAGSKHHPAMEIRISGLNDGEYPFSFDLPAGELGLDETFVGNVRVAGTLRKVSTQFFLNGTVRASYDRECDRCLSEIHRDVEIPLNLFYGPDLGEGAGSGEENDEETRTIAPEQESIVLDEEVRQTIMLDMPTVTGCENIMMAAALAKGRTVIENAAREPEVEELALVLNKMGAKVVGAGTSIITIEGVDELQAIEHAIITDRIEAGTFAVAAAMTKGDVLLEGARPEHMDAIIAKLRLMGAQVSAEADGLRVKGGEIKAVDIVTQPHPGFPTDMQAQFMVLACLAKGQSVIKEMIFENRFMHVPELGRMGADIQISGRAAVVRGGMKLTGANVMATDLRASASLVLAGLVASGKTEVLRVYHLDRGYESIEKKLRGVGAKIKRAKDA